MEKERKNIAIYLPQIYTEFVAGLRREIEKAASGKGYRLIFFTCFGDNSSIDEKGLVNQRYDEGERVVFRLADMENIDGIIFLYDAFARTQWDEIYDMVKNRCKCPVINFRTPLQVPNVYNIYVDDKISFAEMIQHFIDIHHATKINIVTGPKDNVHSEVRLEIYRQVLEENGLPYEKERVYYGNFWKNCGEDLVEKMLDASVEMPEAIVCANDYMALSVIEALKRRGIGVPDQIMVSGYDNIEESKYNHPALTTVRQPVESMGCKALELLEQIWAGEEPEKEVYLPGELMLRQSCGCDSSSEDFSLTYSSFLNERLDRMSFLETSATTMVTFMSGTPNLEECMNCLKEYALINTGFKSFALCLAQHWEKQLSLPDIEYGSSKCMVTMMAGIHNGKELETEQFPVSQLLPSIFLDEEDEAFYIVPIHYLQYYMGYAVVLLDYDIPHNSSVKAWFLHLDNALENIRIRGRLNQVVNELGDLYVRDTLTGLYNRRGFERYGEEFYQSCMENHTQLMIMEIDMDGLKQINDQYGHEEGDICITMIANAMIYASKEDEVCIRSGGDEYIVIGKDYTQEKLDRFMERYDRFIANVNESMNKPYQFGASVGYFMGVPDGVHTTENYLKIADDNMYANKKRRKAISHPGIEVR